jgi:hypothetical protein
MGSPLKERWWVLTRPSCARPDSLSHASFLSLVRQVEIKCPWRRQIVPGEVPHHYLPQIQCQLHVCDLDIAYFVEWQPAHLSDTNTEVINIVPVPRDTAWLERHYDELKGFYDELMEERRNWVPPPPPVCLVRDDLYDDLLATKKRPRLMFQSESEDEDRAPLFIDDV